MTKSRQWACSGSRGGRALKEQQLLRLGSLGHWPVCASNSNEPSVWPHSAAENSLINPYQGCAIFRGLKSVNKFTNVWVAVQDKAAREIYSKTFTEATLDIFLWANNRLTWNVSESWQMILQSLHCFKAALRQTKTFQEVFTKIFPENFKQDIGMYVVVLILFVLMH